MIIRALRSMIPPIDWRWHNWLLFVAGVVLVGSYWGLLSWAPLDDAISRLASHPDARSAFDSASAREEALFVIFAFLLLTPAALLAALFLLTSVLAILLVTLGPVTRLIRIPDAVLASLILGVGGVVAYAKAVAWWPWLHTGAALVARAFLVVH
jgi:hypothetical protein